MRPHHSSSRAPRVDLLEPRALLSAPPTVSDIQFGLTFPVIYQPVRVSAQASDDVGVRAVAFFMDRDGNGRWDPRVDQPLGEDFNVDQDGRWSVTVTPDASWPGYPDFARVVADAVDTEGQWAAARAQRQMWFNGRPAVTSFHASVVRFIEGQQTPYMSVSMSARVEEPFGYPFGNVDVTFFLDKNFNGVWDAGVDTDLGAATGADGRGYRTRNATVIGTSLQGQLCAVGFYGISVPVSERFGDVSVATFVQTSTGGGPAAVPVVTRAIRSNATDPQRDGVEIGQRLKIEFVADTPDTIFSVATLAAATVFFDTNFDQRWTPGVDVDVGAVFFNAGALRAIATFEFEVTPQMGFNHRPFVVTVRNTAGQWGPTYTVWSKIISRPWVELAQPTQPSFPRAGVVTADAVARDDAGVRELFAWIDRDDDGIFDEGEGYQQNALRVEFEPGVSRWRVDINLAQLNYTPGVYRLRLIATDFQGARSAVTSVDVTLT